MTYVIPGMGLGGVSIWQLLILAVIVALVFGTKRIRTIGGDMGYAVKSFRDGFSSKEGEEDEQSVKEQIIGAVREINKAKQDVDEIVEETKMVAKSKKTS